MPVTVIVTRQPVDATQQGYLLSLFGSPGFSLLKEMVASRCIDKQVDAMNLQLYPEHPDAAIAAAERVKAAARLGDALDVLQDLENGQPDKDWWTVKLETRR